MVLTYFLVGRSVNDGNQNTATYSHLANSPLVGQIVFANYGSTRMTTTKQYDYLNRLTAISSSPSASGLMPSAFAYNYNAANQRTRNTFSDGSHWVYQYDALGQVTHGGRYWNDGTPVAGEQFDYAFDTIGNRTQTLAGGDTNGLNLRVANYTANSLNQITQRDVPGTNDVVGAALVGTNVTVNGVAVVDRKAEFFHATVGANNGGGAVWQPVTVAGAGASQAGHLYVAQEPEHFQYDADGNLTNDGRWWYTWDAENRLIGLTVNTNAGPQYQLTFGYDSQGRRIQKSVVSNSVPLATINYLYDGWNLIAEVASGGSLIRNYVWGTDLSGSAQGAGGVGGLLEVTYHGSATTNAFVAYDGNGNVAALVNAGDGTLLANYDYGPFGEVIRASGPMAKLNPFTFQTEYYDWETDKYYWKNRFYDPSPGRWLSRDPAEESGGLNLYGFVGNDPVKFIDPYGFERIELWIAAFISPSEFQYWFYYDPLAFWHGDNRGFNPGTRPMSSRVWHWVVIETDPTKSPVVANISGTGLTSVTFYNAFGIEETSTGLAPPPPVATVTRSGCILNVSVSANTGNPLIMEAPHIKYSYDFSFDTKKGVMTVTGSHGVYPWHEVNTTKGSAVQFSPAPVATPGSLFHSPVPITPKTFSIQTYPCCDAK